MQIFCKIRFYFSPLIKLEIHVCIDTSAPSIYWIFKFLFWRIERHRCYYIGVFTLYTIFTIELKLYHPCFSHFLKMIMQVFVKYAFIFTLNKIRDAHDESRHWTYRYIYFDFRDISKNIIDYSQRFQEIASPRIRIRLN